MTDDPPSMERCRLCRAQAPLRVSHIGPKFVFDWTKRVGKGLRSTNGVNRTVQDGLKCAMLCERCEQRLSSWDRETASQLFVPLNRDGITQHRYGAWLLPFATSVSFRILEFFQDEGLVGLDGQRRPFPVEFADEATVARFRRDGL